MDTPLITSLQNRYAVKKFDPSKKLTEAQLKEVLEAARLTATSYGLQLMKVVVVEDPEVREKLVNCSFGQRQVADASHLLVLCRERDLDLDHFEQYVENISKIRQKDKASLDGYKNMMVKTILTKSEEEQNKWMDKQVYILLGNLLTALAVLNIDSCPMEGFLPEEYDEILELEKEGLASVLVLPIGYRAADDSNAMNKKVRRSEDQFLLRV
jgi:nitroreductase/dihydropteridine reductase